MSIDARPTIAAPDDDPYLWLEEIEGERALAFVEQQNARTLRKFGDDGFARDRDALADILDRPDNIPFIGRRGGLVYNLWKDANNPRGLWRRTTLAEFRKASPAWEIILDLDRLAAEETEDWLFPFLALSYAPLSDAELQGYIDFSRTAAGKKMNTALFAAFDAVFVQISRDLGRAVAQQMTGDDI